jgi:hypothetical protein
VVRTAQPIDDYIVEVQAPDAGAAYALAGDLQHLEPVQIINKLGMTVRLTVRAESQEDAESYVHYWADPTRRFYLIPSRST